MSTLKVLGAALGAALLAASTAQAMTITNRDSSDYTVVIQKGEEEQELQLPAGATIEDACEEGCTIYLAEAEGDHAAAAEDRFVVEDGVLKRDQE